MVARRLVVIVALLPLLAAACGRRSAAGGGRIEVVAAFYPLAAAARLVGGDAVTVHDLTPAGAEPHDLELRPSDFARIRNADLVLYLGGGFQPALEDAIRSSRTPRSLDFLSVLPDADRAGVDPHIWLDPFLFPAIVDRIAGELRELVPSAEAIEMKSRKDAVNRDLGALHELYTKTLKTCARDEFITTHAAFGYLARRYGLQQIAIAGLSPESEPSPRRLEEITRIARERGATTIYFETLVSPRVAQAVARTVGAKTAVLNPIEGLTPAQQKSGENYVGLMQQNLRSLAKGLGCTPAT